MKNKIIQTTFKRLISMTNNKVNKPNVLKEFGQGLVIPVAFFTVVGAGCYAVDRAYGIGQNK